MAKRILVVEDDETSRRLLLDVLGYHGYEVSAEQTGEAALERLRARRLDAALLGTALPGMSGFDVLSQLRASAAAPWIPIVAMTASVMDHDRDEIRAAGFDAYIAKPVNIRELLRTLEILFSDAPA